MAVCKHEGNGFALKLRMMMALKTFTYVLVSWSLSDANFMANFEIAEQYRYFSALQKGNPGTQLKGGMASVYSFIFLHISNNIVSCILS